MNSNKPENNKEDKRRPNPNVSDYKKTILSLDGGGIRGVAVARILAEIEERTGFYIHELFNVVVGTSTGGLLSVLLTIPDKTGNIKSGKEILELYRSQAATIFKERFLGLGQYNPNGPRYDQDGLRSVIKENFADNTTLEDATYGVHVGLCCGDVAYNKAILLNSYRAKHYPHDYRHNTAIENAVLGTSAAPSYFRPVIIKRDDHTSSVKPHMFEQIKNLMVHKKDMLAAKPRRPSVDWYDLKESRYNRDSIELRDGGVEANNPAALGLKLAKKIVVQGDKGEGFLSTRYNFKDVKLVSIGTGSIHVDDDGEELNPSTDKRLQEKGEYYERETMMVTKLWDSLKDGAGNLLSHFISTHQKDSAMDALRGLLSDPFEMTQTTYNDHMKVAEKFFDEDQIDNYKRVQYKVDPEYIKNMSHSGQDDIRSLIADACKYMFKDKKADYKTSAFFDVDSTEELDDNFKQVLKLIDPHYNDHPDYKENLLKKRLQAGKKVWN